MSAIAKKKYIKKDNYIKKKKACGVDVPQTRIKRG